MPNDSRQTILDGIRSSLRHSREAHTSEAATLPRNYRRTTTLDSEERLHLLAERLRDYDASVAFVQPGAVAEAVAAILAARDSIAGPPWVVADGFPRDWLPSTASIQWESQTSVDDLNACSGVITLGSVAIALTGTIVLQHGSGEGRRQTSLLPDRHLCILQSSQVVETVPEAFERLADAAARPLTFISGPSATADIEMTRIRGVHGPRHLEVLIVRV